MGLKTVACNMRSSDVKAMPQKENSGDGGGDITVDSELSLSSENPVQNKVITKAINDVENAIGIVTIDSELISTYQTGHYWNSQNSKATLQTVASYTAFNPIPVEPGYEYTAYIRGGASSKQYPLLFVDSEYNIIWHSIRPSSTGFHTYTGTIPDGASFALITANTVTSNALSSHSFKVYNQQLTNVTELKNSVYKMSAGAIDLTGKKVAIIGDSISTNGDYSPTNPLGNVPEIVITSEDVGITLSAYATEYDVGTVVGGHTISTDDVGTEITFVPTESDVGKYVGKPLTYNPTSRKVWWEVMQEALGFDPIAVCWSGSSISSHEENNDAYKTSYAWHDAQIRKCGIRTPGTMMRTAPDIIIIYRGTNDFSHSPYCVLTNDYFASYNWNYPETDVVANNGYGFKEAISLTVKKLREAYPSAIIVLCTLNIFKRVNYSHYPTNNGHNSLPEYNNAIKEVANFFGIPVIDFSADGITFENMESGLYITESGLTHPTDKGHKAMANKALRDFINSVNSMS